MFHHLHVHTEYSALDGMCKLEEYAKQMSERGYKSLVMTDHGNINGAINFMIACEKYNIKPIIGCEFYVAKDMADKIRDMEHLVLIAKNATGYKNLCKLLSEANIKGFYYKPRIDLPLLKQHKEGLIALSACTKGVINKPFLAKDTTREYNNIEFFKTEFGDDFYLELIPIDYPDQAFCNKHLIALSEIFNMKLVATNDAHYIDKTDQKYQDMLLCIGDKKLMEDPSRFQFTVKSLYLANEEEMISMFNSYHPGLSITTIKTALATTQEIIDKCEPYNMKSFNVFPKVDFLKGSFNTTKEHFEYLLNKALQEKNLDNKEYRARLDEELAQIYEKGFVDYFMMVWDLIRWAKSQDILVGPGRGSSAGSLVCYLLDITGVDPILHGTMFFRFIDPNRNDLPDIDIDFEDLRRSEIRQYLIDTYGRENVALIGTFGQLKGKLVLKDLCRIFNIPSWEVSRITPYILERSSADARASFTVEDAFNQFEVCKKFKEKYPHIIEAATKLEGQVKQYGVSAAGTLVSDVPVTEYAPIEVRGKNKELCIGYDWRNVGYMGLLKLDILGINFLTIINKTLQSLKAKDVIIDLHSIELNDKAVYKSIAENKCTGIFQFETPVMNKIAKAIHIDDFAELVACNALVRPGPFRSGSTESYIAKKQGKKTITYRNEILKEITKDTKGEILYQEQVMALVRNMGNFSWGDTNYIRKYMSKSSGTERMSQYLDMFIKGAKENGIAEMEAKQIWEETSYYGAWSFNKSHSVAYSMLSYWCAWLKYYHPKEYLTAFVNYNSNDHRIFEGVRHIKELGYELRPPVHQHANEKLIIIDKIAYVGLCHVKGIGDKVMEELTKLKDCSNIDEWSDRVSKRVVNSKIKKILVNIGYFDGWGTIPELNQYFNLDYKEEENTSPEEWLYDKCSILFCDNLLKKYDNFIAGKINPDIEWNTLDGIDASEESEDKGNYVLVKGIMNKINLKNKDYSGTKGKGEQDYGRKDIEAGNENRYCVSDFFDGTGYLRISFYPEVYAKYEKEIWESKNNAPVIIRGTIGPDRIYVKEFVNVEAWKKHNIDDSFTRKLKAGIKSQEQIDACIKEIIDNIDKEHEVELSTIRNHMCRTGQMAFVSFSVDDVKLETVIWPDAYQRWRNHLSQGNRLKIRFSYFKENKLYLDTAHGKVVSA